MLRLFNQMIDDAPTESRGRDWKTLLQERLAAKQLPAAEYTVRTTGPDHDLTFYVDVLVDGVLRAAVPAPRRRKPRCTPRIRRILHWPNARAS